MAVKRILRYIAGTRNQGITFGLTQDLEPWDTQIQTEMDAEKLESAQAGMNLWSLAVPQVGDQSNRQWRLLLLSSLSTSHLALQRK